MVAAAASSTIGTPHDHQQRQADEDMEVHFDHAAAEMNQQCAHHHQTDTDRYRCQAAAAPHEIEQRGARDNRAADRKCRERAGREQDRHGCHHRHVRRQKHEEITIHPASVDGFALRGFGRHRGRGIELETQQRRHRAGADRHRLLHGAAANAQQPRGVGDGERAGRRQRRIFAERMAGDELRVALEIDRRLRPRSTRIAASDTAISAGWAFSVSVSLSAGPSHMVAVSFSPSAASTSSNTARAGAKASASALPMPTAWLPWPGNTKADRHRCPFAKSGRKTPRYQRVSSCANRSNAAGAENRGRANACVLRRKPL